LEPSGASTASGSGRETRADHIEGRARDRRGTCAGVNKQSYARSIAAGLFPEGVIEEELRYPVTTGSTDHPVATPAP